MLVTQLARMAQKPRRPQERHLQTFVGGLGVPVLDYSLDKDDCREPLWAGAENPKVDSSVCLDGSLGTVEGQEIGAASRKLSF